MPGIEEIKEIIDRVIKKREDDWYCMNCRTLYPKEKVDMPAHGLLCRCGKGRLIKYGDRKRGRKNA